MSEDTTHATTGLIARLDAAETEAGVVRLRHRSYELLDLSPGASVVDVGCGTGRAVAELHQRGTPSHDPSRRQLPRPPSGPREG
ncbi:hypothetical protein [Micromonospora chersina]|uniref:hypothetical protein n=1 Tax=Micromonospora chersina TaxID=47854 RepID=UPI003D8AD3CD